MRALQSTKVIHKSIQIDVRVCNVVKSASKSTGLTTACPDCHSDLSKPSICRKCDKEIDYHDIQKKFKFTEEDQRILTTEELDKLGRISSQIKVEGSIDKDQFKPSLITGSYYILPQNKLKKKSEQDQLQQNLFDYDVLKQSIEKFDKADKLNTVRFSIKGKEKIGVLTLENDYIVLLTLAFPEYVQQVDEEIIVLGESNKKSSQRYAEKFIKSIKPIKLSSLIDTYKETLQKILEGKAEPEPKKELEQITDKWSSI